MENMYMGQNCTQNIEKRLKILMNRAFIPDLHLTVDVGSSKMNESFIPYNKVSSYMFFRRTRRSLT